MSNRFNRTFSRKTFLLLLPGAALAGCGGGKSTPLASGSSQDSSSDAIPSGNGRVAVTVRWPAQDADATSAASRLIPQNAQSLFLQLTSRATGVTYSLVISRRDHKPATQTATFAQYLPVGEYVLACAARDQDLGLGSTLAIAAANVTVVEGQTASVSLTLQSTASSISLPDTDVRNGQTFVVMPQIRNNADELIMVATADLVFTVISGGGAVQSNGQSGVFNTVSQGVVRFRVALRDNPTLFAEGNVSILGDTGLTFAPQNGPLVGQITPTVLTAAQTGSQPQSGVPFTLQFVSLNPETATVTSDGKLTPVATGSVLIRVVSTGGQLLAGQSITRDFAIAVGRATSVVIDNPPASLTAGQSVTLQAHPVFAVYPSGPEPIVWSVSSGGGFAAIDASTGVLQGIGSPNGPQTVTARATLAPTGQFAETSIVINSFGGVHVGVQ